MDPREHDLWIHTEHLVALLGFRLLKTNGMMNTTMRYCMKEANIGMQLTVYCSLQPIQNTLVTKAHKHNLACTYLQWKHNDKYHNTNLSMEECHIFHVTTLYLWHTLNQNPEREACVSIHQCPEEPANVALLRLGLLGCSPVEPSVAIEHIQSQVDDALGCNEMDWWLKHMCPCCTYEVNGKEILKLKILVSCDSNNSCKQIAGTAQSDHCKFSSSYYISC
ncbi:hypothetical protein BD769DRAFT_1386113 [Suillus cothurnatus]|nr:hypothetical protein BD769DRAFT_1386113 [Suillus cothurnatus]